MVLSVEKKVRKHRKVKWKKDKAKRIHNPNQKRTKIWEKGARSIYDMIKILK